MSLNPFSFFLYLFQPVDLEVVELSLEPDVGADDRPGAAHGLQRLLVVESRRAGEVGRRQRGRTGNAGEARGMRENIIQL